MTRPVSASAALLARQRSVPCPAERGGCGAPAGRVCLTPAGSPTKTHRARLDEAAGRPAVPHCPSCTCHRAGVEARWNEAIDWLLNSRHTGDPGIQRAFWGIVDGKYTRKQADKI